MVDILAAELKMDRVEIRLKNFIQKDEFPFPTAIGFDLRFGAITSLPSQEGSGDGGL